jgi:hypothetical protein
VTWQNAEMALFLLYSWSEFSATKGQSWLSLSSGVGLRLRSRAVLL